MSDTIDTPYYASSMVSNRRHQIFPVLNEAQFAVLDSYGHRQSYKAGEIL